ncbi:unnamed protein product [Schistosoma turkestanicum]|nr:unnamed protein product [Schistosoma turkestanicum]
MNSADAVICGRNQITASVIKMLRKVKNVNIIGYWCESTDNKIYADVTGIQVINGTFEDLISNKDMQFLFLCDTPVNQLNFVSKVCGLNSKQSSVNANTQGKPFLIILPPVSPNYDIEMLEKAKYRVGFAMPFRYLPVSSLLCTHLNCTYYQLKSRNNYEFSRLPAHWLLGNIESIHIKLSTNSLVDGSDYSWLCESEGMGGGLLNMFCPGLIDLVHLLSGGLQITSVTSICRTFGRGTNGLRHPTRHISADDYVTIMGELDIPPMSGFNKPVVVIILSSDIPFTRDEVCKPYEAHFCDNHCFRLGIEVSGSSGSFMIDESKRQISWTPRKSISSNHRESESRLAKSNYESIFTNKRPGNIEESKFEEDHNEDVLLSPISSIVSRTQASTKLNIDLKDEMTEIANLSLNDSSHDSESAMNAQHCCLSATGEAWSNWINSLTKNFSDRESFESLLASPNHWGYIQSVMHAIIKSSQLRCWIDVQTGKRM